MLGMRALVAAACVAGVAAVVPAAALADADPASDFLPSDDVYAPYDARVSDKVEADVRGVVKAAKKAGYPIKVAIIATRADLGGVPELFNRPSEYAVYLGREITFNKKAQPLLVAMPVGLGVYQAGPKSGAAIAGVKVDGESGDALGRASVEAVQKLAKAAGHPIRGFTPSATGNGGGGSSAALIAIPVVLLVIVFGVLSYRRLGDDED
jgi:hypothetical protein